MGLHMSQLRDLLELDRPGKYEFIGDNPPEARDSGHLFGGQVIAQALMAAGTTVEPGRDVHSLHCYFLLAGDPSIPIVFRVDPIRDGRTYTTRRVVAEQRGREIFAMTTSFAIAEEGFQHQVLSPPGLTGAWPNRAGNPIPRPTEIDDTWLSGRVHRDLMDFRRINTDGEVEDAPSLKVWARLIESLPDTSLFQVCGLAYISDMMMLPTAFVAHGLENYAAMMVASLDHSMWFHQPFHVENWLLHETDNPAASQGRALTRGQVFDESGLLVASVAQEGVVRTRRTPKTT